MSANLCQTRPPSTGRLRTSPGPTRDHPVNISSGRTGTCDYIGEQVGADCSLAGARKTFRSIPDRNLADVAWSRPPRTHGCVCYERWSTAIWRFAKINMQSIGVGLRGWKQSRWQLLAWCKDAGLYLWLHYESTQHSDFQIFTAYPHCSHNRTL